MNIRHHFAGSLALFTLVNAPSARAVSFTNFSEFGTTVNGYQDDFTGTTLNPDWLEIGAGSGPGPHFELSGTGTLLMHPANSDPNKLLYNPASGYDNAAQNVLALIRVSADGTNNPYTRGGIAAVSDPGGGQGLNLLFRYPGQNGPGNHFNLLDDARAWGPSTGGGDWVTGGYKWLRLVVDASGVPSGKIWDAGIDPEPAGFNLSWDPRNRFGLAGLTTNSSSPGFFGDVELEADYILIQAAGLPPTQVVPEPATGLLGLIGTAALGLARPRRMKSATG